MCGRRRRRRNAAWHARRVPVGGFAAATDAAIAEVAAGPRLGAFGGQAEREPIERDFLTATKVGKTNSKFIESGEDKNQTPVTLVASTSVFWTSEAALVTKRLTRGKTHRPFMKDHDRLCDTAIKFKETSI